MKYGSITTGIIADGLVFNMDAANRASYPRAGTTATDTVGNTSGTLNGATFSNVNSGVFNFDGTGDYIDYGVDSSIDTGDLSVTFWFNKDSSASGFQYVFNSGSGSAKAGFAFAFSGTNIYIARKTRTHTAGFTTYTNIGISADIWHHISLTYNDTSNNFIAYLDSESVHTSTGTTATNAASSEIIFGRVSNSATAYYQGNIGNAHIYNRALSSNEVLHNYNALKSRFGL